MASRDYINAQGDSEREQSSESRSVPGLRRVAEISASYQKRSFTPEMKAASGQFSDAQRAYERYLPRIIDLADAGKDKQAWGENGKFFGAKATTPK